MSDSVPNVQGAQVVIRTSTAGPLEPPLIIDAAELFQHPLAKEFRFCPLSEQELQQLADDIVKHGLHDKIVIYELMVLEGWTRYQALKRIGRGFKGAQFTLYNARSGDPKLYVLARNVLRRHLSEGQRSAYGKLYYDLITEAEGGRPAAPESVPEAVANNQPIEGGVCDRETASALQKPESRIAGWPCPRNGSQSRRSAVANWRRSIATRQRAQGESSSGHRFKR